MVGFLVGLLPISPTTRLRLVDNVSVSRSDASEVPTAMDVIHEISRNMVIATVNGEFIVTRYADVYRGRILIELRTLNKPQLLGEAENITLQKLMACISLYIHPFKLSLSVCKVQPTGKSKAGIQFLSHIQVYLSSHFSKIWDRGPGGTPGPAIPMKL